MAGRPEGSVESPEKLLRLEVGSLLKQTRRLRSIIDTQIDYFESQLNSSLVSLNLEGHILIVTTLKELQKESINTIKEGMKILDKDTAKPVSGDDPDEVLREMQGGRG